ncbi:MAG: hypothetical protein ACRCYO_09005 [Bacteroidia bacterium]
MDAKEYIIIKQFPWRGAEILTIAFPKGEIPKVGMTIILNNRERIITGVFIFDRDDYMIDNNIHNCVFGDVTR